MKNDKLISVSEYAAIKGITTAAVYKALKTSLQKYVVQLPTVDNAKKSQVKLNYTALVKDGLITVDKKVDENSATVDNPSITAALIESLQEQLRVKDREILALTQALADVTRLVDQSQQLMAHQQKLLSEDVEKPKKGAFSWLFTKTPKADTTDTETVTEPREI